MIKYIKPLPIAEEMLGAYLESNLALHDARYVEQMLQGNDELSAFVNELSISEDLASSYLIDETPNLGIDFTLPEIPMGIEISMDTYVIPLEFDPSFADVAACAMTLGIADDDDSYDLNFEENMLDSNINESIDSLDCNLNNYSEESNMFKDDCGDFFINN